jgi:hypothetical protein
VLAGAQRVWPALAWGQRPPAEPGLPPIVFVHGNGDQGAPDQQPLALRGQRLQARQLFAVNFSLPRAQ